MNKVNFDIKVYDNIIEITPKEGVLDNSIYDIRFKDIKTKDHKSSYSDKVEITTELTPCYASIDSVKSIIAKCNLPDTLILFQIREASKLADFINEGVKIDKNNVPFGVNQFVKYKAAYECLLGFYIQLTTGGNLSGKLGKVEFKTQFSISNVNGLLKELQGKVDHWRIGMLGYIDNCGICKPSAALIGRKIPPKPLINHVPISYSRGTENE